MHGLCATQAEVSHSDTRQRGPERPRVAEGQCAPTPRYVVGTSVLVASSLLVSCDNIQIQPHASLSRVVASGVMRHADKVAVMCVRGPKSRPANGHVTHVTAVAGLGRRAGTVSLCPCLAAAS